MQPTRRVLLIGAAAASLGACATAGKSDNAGSKGNASAANPLGVAEDAPLDALDDATGELLAKRVNPQQWADRVQKAADGVRADASLTKHTRQG